MGIQNPNQIPPASPPLQRGTTTFTLHPDSIPSISQKRKQPDSDYEDKQPDYSPGVVDNSDSRAFDHAHIAVDPQFMADTEGVDLSDDGCSLSEESFIDINEWKPQSAMEKTNNNSIVSDPTVMPNKVEPLGMPFDEEAGDTADNNNDKDEDNECDSHSSSSSSSSSSSEGPVTSAEIPPTYIPLSDRVRYVPSASARRAVIQELLEDGCIDYMMHSYGTTDLGECYWENRCRCHDTLRDHREDRKSRQRATLLAQGPEAYPGARFDGFALLPSPTWTLPCPMYAETTGLEEAGSSVNKDNDSHSTCNYTTYKGVMVPTIIVTTPEDVILYPRNVHSWPDPKPEHFWYIRPWNFKDPQRPKFDYAILVHPDL